MTARAGVMPDRRRAGKGLSRREALVAAGLGLGLVARGGRALAAPVAPPARLVLLMQANGTHQPAFWPGPSFTSPILEPLLSDARLRAQVTVIKGVSLSTTGPGNAHDHGFTSLWTGVPTVGTPSEAWGGGLSLDQVLKRALKPPVPFPTVNCGVLAAYMGPKNGHRTSFSYVGPKRQIPTETDPYRLNERFFGGLEARAGAAADPDAEARRALSRLKQRRSVLDFAARDLESLTRRVGAAERAKLDAHATALRELEARLAGTMTSAAARCAAREPSPAGLDVRLEDNVPALTDLMLDTVAVALACDQTRIVTFPFGYCGNQWRYKWLGFDVDAHEEIAHRDDGGDRVAGQRMVSIGRWHAERVARFCRALDAIPEGAGTVLDHTLVVWANENATGTHIVDPLPIVLIGRAAGRLRKPGRTVDLDPAPEARVHQRLATTLLRLMGVEAMGFGDRPECGGFEDLL